MTEATTLALRFPHDATVDAEITEKTVASQSFSFASRRWPAGVKQATGGVAFAAMGIFLLTQIASTPALTTQLAILGSICLIGGAVFFFKATRDLYGRLTIDNTGISVEPSLVGFSIRWTELKRWQVQLDAPSSQFPFVRFWTTESDCPLFIPNNWLTDTARDRLRHTLYTHAADKHLAAS